MSALAPSRLAIAALVLGVLSALVVTVGLIWASRSEAEAVFAPMFFTPVPAAIVGLAGVVVGIVALARHAWPRWISAVGLVLSAITVAIAVAALIQVILIINFLNSQTFEF